MNALALDLMLQAELPAATRGSQEAYGRIVHACQNTVTAIALAITRDVQASEDIAQEAFLKAWQRVPGRCGTSARGRSPGAWSPSGRRSGCAMPKTSRARANCCARPA